MLETTRDGKSVASTRVRMEARECRMVVSSSFGKDGDGEIFVYHERTKSSMMRVKRLSMGWRRKEGVDL